MAQSKMLTAAQFFGSLDILESGVQGGPQLISKELKSIRICFISATYMQYDLILQMLLATSIEILRRESIGCPKSFAIKCFVFTSRAAARSAAGPWVNLLF